MANSAEKALLDAVEFKLVKKAVATNDTHLLLAAAELISTAAGQEAAIEYQVSSKEMLSPRRFNKMSNNDKAIVMQQDKSAQRLCARTTKRREKALAELTKRLEATKKG